MKTRLLCLLSTISLAACATAEPLKRAAIVGEKAPKTALVVDFEIHHSDPVIADAKCQIEMRHLGRGTNYSVVSAKSPDLVMVHAAPGKYQVRRIYCYSRAQWEPKENGLIIEVPEGKIAYLSFVVDEAENRDTIIHYGAAGSERMRKLQTIFAASDHPRLVNAYTSIQF